jgi:hypothetical protein
MMNYLPPVSGSGGKQNLVARYEELRNQVLSGGAGGLGLVLFLRQGMKAWMEAWPRSTLKVPDVRYNEAGWAEVNAGQLRSELANLLASMVLHIQ